jgi:hypothetical protein
MMEYQIRAHEMRKKIGSILDETGLYDGRRSRATSMLIQTLDQLDILNRDIYSQMQKLTELRETIQRQVVMTESFQRDRDLLSQAVLNAIRENSAMVETNRDLSNDLRRLKQEIREQDIMCMETHAMQRKTQMQNVTLRREIKRMVRRLHEADQVTTETRNKVSRARYFESECQLYATNERYTLDGIAETAISLQRMVVRKHREKDLLFEQSRALMHLIQLGDSAYRRRCVEIEDLKEQLQIDVARQTHLSSVKRFSRALHLERLRIEKLLIEQQGKKRALEDEIDKPMNVHHWRFLESTNPELAEMIRMNVSLRDRLMGLIVRQDRLRRVREQLRERSVTQERHLEKSYGGCYEDERASLMEMLKEKTALLTQMRMQAVQQGQTVAGSRDRIMNVRVMVREEKSETRETQEIVDKIRAKTALGRRLTSKIATPTQPDRPESRFVGGGFGVAGIIQPNAPGLEQQAKLEKHRTLVVPSNTPRRDLKALRPRGWNPKRGPLSPYLKTAGDVS